MLRLRKLKGLKSQITIFVIIAIAIVAAVVLYFLFMQERTNLTTQGSSLDKVPSQIRPIYDSVQQCLEKKSLDGLEILRLQGGYIIPEGEDVIDVQTEGRHVVSGKLVEGAGKTKNPVWLGDELVAVPSLEFMQQQLNDYLRDEIRGCVDSSFKDFESRGAKIRGDVGNIEAALGDSVNVKIKDSIDVDFKEQSFKYGGFFYKVPINFTGIYNVAYSLSLYEVGYEYLEEHAQSLISIYSYAGGAKQERDLPPLSFTDTSLSCRFVSWSKQEVEKSMKSIFQENYKHLKMKGSAFTPIKVKGEIQQGVYNGFVKDYFPNEMPNVHIDFSYNPEDDLKLEIYPAELVPEKITGSGIPFMPMFCSFEYSFKYNTFAPIIIRIKDDKSMKIRGQDYVFYFPMRLYLVTIGRNREPNAKEIEALTGEKVYDCKDLTRQVDISIVDFANKPVDSADVLAECEGELNDCWLGRTDADGEAKISIPRCDNISISVMRPGYSTTRGGLKNKYVLGEIKNFTVDVKIVNARKFAEAYYLTVNFTKNSCGKSPGMLRSQAESMIAANDKATIYLFGATSSAVIYPDDKTIELSNGKYSYTSMLSSKVKINPSSYGTELISFNQDKNKAYEGSWILGSSTINMEIDSSELGNSKALFYVLADHTSTERLEVKSFDRDMLRDDRIEGTIEVDDNCDGKKEARNVTIMAKDYAKFLKPKLSKI